MSVLFISAELEEVLRLSHRVVVLRDRHVVADLENDGLTVDSLLALIADGSTSKPIRMPWHRADGCRRARHSRAAGTSARRSRPDRPRPAGGTR